ncbi:MAG: hypothetical protein LUC92_08745 [Clostridiales bacterium]|nr:hypothetical protein [Clostridiales bacterium]
MTQDESRTADILNTAGVQTPEQYEENLRNTIAAEDRDSVNIQHRL